MTKNMKKWNGKDKTGRYQYPLEDIEFWDMKIDEGGTIWYHQQDKERKLSVWCIASKLTGHMQKLENIKRRI